MQAFDPFLNGLENAPNQLWEHIRTKTMASLAAQAAKNAGFTSTAEIESRGLAVREAFLASIGGLPQTSAPLNAQLVGAIARDGYRIEKVIFESLPRVHVTSLLYLPDGLDGPAPGILFLCGHAREAKAFPEYQRVCHDFARNGFVVLAVDPTGQGERVTTFDPQSGEMTVPWGTVEHSYQGLVCGLTGSNIARYFLWDALRGLDYLQSRQEVDPERLGVTGNSGGGTQTTLVCMSGDLRVKAAAPCTYVTSREHYFMSGQAQDAEQIQFGITGSGINYDDMFYPFAPRPLFIGAVADDFFNPEGTALTFDRLKRVYRLYGEPDRLEWVLGPGGHRYSAELRQAAVNFFRRHLHGANPGHVTRRDDEIPVLPGAKLWCTQQGHVRTAYPNAKSPLELNQACIPERRPARNAAELRRRIRHVLRIEDRLAHPVALFPRNSGEFEIAGRAAHRVVFRSEEFVAGAGTLIGGEDASEAAIVVHPGGTCAMEAAMETGAPALEAGYALFVFDVRGTGALKQQPVNRISEEWPRSYYSTPQWLAVCAYALGECLFGMRVFDVLRAAEFLRTRFEKVHLCGRGLEPALWGYYAGALDEGIASVRLDGLLESYEALISSVFYRRDFLPSAGVHGVLREFDLPELRMLYEGRLLDVQTAEAHWDAAAF